MTGVPAQFRAVGGSHCLRIASVTMVGQIPHGVSHDVALDVESEPNETIDARAVLPVFERAMVEMHDGFVAALEPATLPQGEFQRIPLTLSCGARIAARLDTCSAHGAECPT